MAGNCDPCCGCMPLQKATKIIAILNTIYWSIVFVLVLTFTILALSGQAHVNSLSRSGPTRNFGLTKREKRNSDKLENISDNKLSPRQYCRDKYGCDSEHFCTHYTCKPMKETNRCKHNKHCGPKKHYTEFHYCRYGSEDPRNRKCRKEMHSDCDEYSFCYWNLRCLYIEGTGRCKKDSQCGPNKHCTELFWCRDDKDAPGYVPFPAVIAVMIILILVSIFGIVFGVILFCGAKNENACKVMVWLIATPLLFLLTIILSCVLLSFLGLAATAPATLLGVYFFIVVFLFYLELKENSVGPDEGTRGGGIVFARQPSVESGKFNKSGKSTASKKSNKSGKSKSFWKK